MKRTDADRAITRQKYSPSSSRERVSFQGPARVVKGRLTSQTAGFIQRLFANFVVIQSAGDRSAHSLVGRKTAFSGRRKKVPKAEESSVSGARSSVWASCRDILSGASRSSASSHWM